MLIDGKGYVKVADFGFAKRLLPGEKTYTLCGTPEYMSPELYRQSGHNKAVDWWALGVLIYEMVAGAPPFYSPNADSTDQMRRILAAKYSFPEGVSPAFKDVVRRFLSVNAVHRLGSLKGGVKDVKLHPWFKSTDWIAMTRREGKPPFVPPLRGDDDHSCFDEYDPTDAAPGRGVRQEERDVQVEETGEGAGSRLCRFLKKKTCPPPSLRRRAVESIGIDLCVYMNYRLITKCRTRVKEHARRAQGGDHGVYLFQFRIPRLL